MANEQGGSDSGRLVSLGFKKSTEGLSTDEQKEYEKLQTQGAMQRRMSQSTQPQGG